MEAFGITNMVNTFWNFSVNHFCLFTILANYNKPNYFSYLHEDPVHSYSNWCPCDARY